MIHKAAVLRSVLKVAFKYTKFIGKKASTKGIALCIKIYTKEEYKNIKERKKKMNKKFACF